MNKKCLVLFSGTRSIEKVFENKNWECRGVDIDNFFKPYYNVDLLKWDYKKELINWVPDYIHASFVCKEFSIMKNGKKRDLDLGNSLLNKAEEIIEWLKTINPNILITLENPRNKYVEVNEYLNTYYRQLTSYCKYGFEYKKPTYIWSNMKDLKLLNMCCLKRNSCKYIKEKRIHPVVISFRAKNKNQITSITLLQQLKKEKGEYVSYKHNYFVYRIPPLLVEDIFECVNRNYKRNKFKIIFNITKFKINNLIIKYI